VDLWGLDNAFVVPGKNPVVFAEGKSYMIADGQLIEVDWKGNMPHELVNDTSKTRVEAVVDSGLRERLQGVSTLSAGLLNAAGGAGAAVGSAGLAAAPAYVWLIYGCDQASTGLTMLLTGKDLRTQANQLLATGLNKAGVDATTSQKCADTTELVANLAAGTKGFADAYNAIPRCGKIRLAPVTVRPVLTEPAARAGAGAGDDMVTVFRGVHAEHPQLGNAFQGRAAPMGGHSSAARHNAGDNASVFTSWTTDYSTAVNFATGSGPGGVVLCQTVPRSSLIHSPDVFLEFEVLRQGPIEGATPIILRR
jgi:hypothetical protein